MRGRSAFVVGAFALLVAGCGGGAPTSAAHGNSAHDVVAVDDGAPFTCPDPESQDPLTGADTLPAGATAALICYRDNHELWFPPAGALTHGVGRLVRLVNAQRIVPPSASGACNADLGPAYSIVLRYAGGTRTIQGENDGCRTVSVGSVQRAGTQRVYDAYLAALARQRAHSEPPDVHLRPPACPTDRLQPFSPLADPALTAAASVCRHLDHHWNGHRRGRPLTASQVRVLRRDLATARPRTFQPTARDHLCRSPILRGPLRVSALDGWGDELVVDLACDTYRFTPRTGHTVVTVHLLPRTARMLTHH